MSQLAHGDGAFVGSAQYERSRRFVEPDGPDRGYTRPNFMLVGAMRCGTSALYRLLDGNPLISMSSPKEPHHFVAQHYDAFTGPGDEWVASQVVRTRGHYERIMQPREGARISGEASATYLYYQDALSSIAERVPGVKIVVLLREPVARSYSAYWYLRSQNREWLTSFDAALEAEDARIRDGFGPMWHYASASHYADGLRLCYRLFGADRVFVSTNERLVRDPRGFLVDLSAFLDVPCVHTETISIKTNGSGQPHSTLLNAVLHPPPIIRRVLRAVMPSSSVRLVRRARKSNLRPIPRLDVVRERALRAQFANDVDEVSGLTGLDLSEWRPHNDVRGDR